MRRLFVLLVAVLAAAFAAALIARPGTATTAAEFRSPDAGAACKLEQAALVCSSLGSAGSLSLRPGGTVRVVSRLPWWDASTPVLRRYRHGAITCTLLGEAIVCRSRGAAIRVSGDGFAVVS